MKSLKMSITQVGADFRLLESLRPGTAALSACVRAIVGFSGERAQRGKDANVALNRLTHVINNGGSLVAMTQISPALEGALRDAMAVLQDRCSAVALEEIGSLDPWRKPAYQLNQALAKMDFILTAEFDGHQLWLADLGIAAAAAPDMPWEGQLILVPSQWHMDSWTIRGASEQWGAVVLDMAHDRTRFVDLMRQCPAYIGFFGVGQQNRRVIGVVARGDHLQISQAPDGSDLPLERRNEY